MYHRELGYEFQTYLVNSIWVEYRAGQNTISLDITEVICSPHFVSIPDTAAKGNKLLRLPFNHYWHFYDCNNELVEHNELELLQGEVVMVCPSITRYYLSASTSEYDPEIDLWVYATKPLVELRKLNQLKLFPFMRILGYAIYSNGKDQYLHVHTREGIHSFEYRHFMWTSGLSRDNLDLLTEPCLSYLYINTYKTEGAEQACKPDMQAAVLLLGKVDW